MADVTEGSLMGRTAERAGALVQYTGAVVSVALIAGVGIWGYKLFVRDVTGVPVVRAMEGPMRQSPANPGGEVALNTGLSVNAVAAQGEAAPPEDVLVLAPRDAGLAPEDMEVQSMAEAGEVMPEDSAVAPVVADPLAGDMVAPVVLELDADAVAPTTEGVAAVPDAVAAALPDTPLSADQVLALADQIAAGATPLTALADGADVPVALSVDGAVVAADAAPADVDVAVADALAAPLANDAALALVPASVPGVAVALRPPVRPASLSGAVATDPAAPASEAASAVVVSAVEIPVGTNLVQLGAFPSAEIAASEWDRLSGRFAEFLVGKERVIQEATSGGDTFYRLRAMGFADLEDARRFCAVLEAEDAGCIPVVMQ